VKLKAETSLIRQASFEDAANDSLYYYRLHIATSSRWRKIWPVSHTEVSLHMGGITPPRCVLEGTKICRYRWLGQLGTVASTNRGITSTRPRKNHTRSSESTKDAGTQTTSVLNKAPTEARTKQMDYDIIRAPTFAESLQAGSILKARVLPCPSRTHA
jgi:hypothetical protein